MKHRSRVLALLMAVVLMVPSLAAMAEGEQSVSVNTVRQNSTTGNPEQLEQSNTDTAENPEPENGGAAQQENENNKTALNAAGRQSDITTLSGNEAPTPPERDVVRYNTGNCVIGVMSQEMSDYLDELNKNGDTDEAERYLYGYWNVKQWDVFQPDGSYTIPIAEPNPFFPYEVQFTGKEGTTRAWFMTPEDSVEVDGHTFRVAASIDETIPVGMNLEIAGDTIVIYPEKKYFTNDSDGTEALSLIPLRRYNLDTVDLTGYTPVELSKVKIKPIYGGNKTGAQKIAWNDGSSTDSYTIISIEDTLNLAGEIGGYSSTHDWEWILGDGDQLNPDNIRYFLSVEMPGIEDWLIPQIYVQNDQGSRSAVEVEDADFYGWYLRTDISFRETEDKDVYVSLCLDKNRFTDTNFGKIKMVSGSYQTAAEAVEALKTQDITSQMLCADMTLSGAGYKVPAERDEIVFTLLVYDMGDNLIWHMPFRWELYESKDRLSLRLYQKTENGDAEYIDGIWPSEKEQYTEFYLSEGEELNGMYTLVMNFHKHSGDAYPGVTAVYAGQYATIAQAVAAGAKDIKEVVLGDIEDVEGYTADYSKGVYFTVFAGADNDPKQIVYSFCARTKKSSSSSGTWNPPLEDGTSIHFYGLLDADGNEIPIYVIRSWDDSYAEENFITILVGQDTDLNKEYAPVFRLSEKATAYTEGSVAPEVSGKSCHSFANGPIQYSVSAENGENSKNYWVQIKKASNANGQLYISSLTDQDAHTRVENGITYSTREVMLDSYHSYRHDICMVNVGEGPLTGLSAELSSDVLEMDPYWTLNGELALAGLSTVETPEYDSDMAGELPNLAKIRLRAKSNVSDGTDVSGTLTIKSDGKVLMVLTLTGVVGDPCITTAEIPDAVKYVPYGTMIQNSNKYSWIQSSYKLVSGKLPEGMEIKPNGELYGVPKETGTFTFRVQVVFTSTKEAYRFPSGNAELTLTVKENTNDNVFNESDVRYGYSLVTPIGVETTAGSHDFYLEQITDSVFVSEGVYGHYKDLWLNGEKLTAGVDYTSESGSTRITIRSQTLQDKALKTGNNTIAAEFRVDGDENKELRRTAQNFHLDRTTFAGDDSSHGSGGNGSGGNGSGSHGSGGSGSNSGGSNGSGSASGSGSGSGGNSADSPAGSVTIGGDLVDSTGAPAAGLVVELHSTPRSTQTQSNGFFQFTGVEFGWHELFVKDDKGNVLAYGNFELKEGSEISLTNGVLTVPGGAGVTLRATMADGTLSLSLVNAGKTAGTALTAASAATGDGTPSADWLLALLLSGMALAVYGAARRKRRIS